MVKKRSVTEKAAIIIGISSVAAAMVGAIVSGIVKKPPVEKQSGPTPQIICHPVDQGEDKNIYMIGSGTFVRFAKKLKSINASGPAGQDGSDPYLHVLEGATGSGLRFLAESLLRGGNILAMASRRASPKEFEGISKEPYMVKKRIFEILVGVDSFEVLIKGKNSIKSPQSSAKEKSLIEELKAQKIQIEANSRSIDVRTLKQVVEIIKGGGVRNVSIVTTRPPSGTLALYEQYLGADFPKEKNRYFSLFQSDFPEQRWIAFGSTILNQTIKDQCGEKVIHLEVTSDQNGTKSRLCRPLFLYGVMTRNDNSNRFCMDPHVAKTTKRILKRMNDNLEKETKDSFEAQRIKNQIGFFNLEDEDVKDFGCVSYVQASQNENSFIFDPNRSGDRCEVIGFETGGNE